jgi:hypothetical protein
MNDNELRLKIAELKGWTFAQVSPDTSKHFCRINGNSAGWWNKAGSEEWICASCSDPFPDWPVDIAAAWELVEEMKQGVTGVFVDWCINDMLSPFKWFCGVPKNDSKEWITGRDSDTAPRAICHTWIAWKENAKNKVA